MKPSGRAGWKLPSAEEMAAFDAATISAGTSGTELMERAGKAVLARAVKRYPKAFSRKTKILILCGPGNNGGDGLVIARHLLRQKQPVEVIIGSASKYSKEFVTQTQAFAAKGGTLKIFGRPEAKIPRVTFSKCSDVELSSAVQSASLIFDSMLGTGQRSAPRGVLGRMVTIANKAVRKSQPRPVMVSVDLPTGVDSGTGAVYEPAVSADFTVSIQLPKRGMFQSPAMERCGELAIVDIGIAPDGPCEFSILTAANVPMFPRRTRDAHKGKAGRVLIVGGSQAMPGAPLLAGLGCLRTGAGLVTATVFKGGVSQAPRALEIIDLPLDAGEFSGFSKRNLSEIKSAVAATDVVIFGPGIGRAPETVEFTTSFIRELKRSGKPVLVDADALINLSDGGPTPLGELFIITPHPGEAAKLLGTDIKTVQSDRYSSARSLAKLTKGSVVLKGASSIIYNGDAGVVNTTGNRWMATAGSGDVLCGIIAALIAQGLSVYDAGKFGVFLHGAAGDRAHEAHGGPIIASDIAAALPFVIGKLLR